MKSLACFVGGAALVALVLAFLVAGSTGATPGLGPCSVEKSGGTYSTIQAAVNDTNCDPINVGAGTFTETVNITRTVTVQGQGPAQTIVDGTTGGSVFTIQVGTTVTLTGLTIQNGLAQYGGAIHNHGTLTVSDSRLRDNDATGTFPDGKGGGIYNEGKLNVAGSTLSGNSAKVDGGGIYNYDYATLTVTHSTLISNTATDYDGGGIFNLYHGTVQVTNSALISNSAKIAGGGIRNWGTLHVSHSTLEDNEATGSGPPPRGGGVGNSGTLTLSASTLRGNAADTEGGGIWNEGTLTVTHSTLSGNSADLGGGIVNDDGGTLAVADSTLSGNTSTNGGGIFNAYGGTLAVADSTLSGNTATNWDGGGIYNYGTLAVTLSTLSGNTATNHDGGGIFNIGTADVTHSTLVSNSAKIDGGAIGNWATLTVTNSIIANSPSGADCDVDPGSPITSLGHNIDSDGTCNLTGPGDQPGTDPMLGPLQDNGGPTWTHALLPGSPAVDAGSCPGATADQRGFPRPVDVPAEPDADDGCDIGAFEAQWSATATCQVPGVNATPRRIQGAVNDPWCSVVEVAAGTFTETVSISRTVTVQGQAQGLTIVDGDAGGSVFTIQAGTTVTLTGLTIQNGLADYGAGIYNEGALEVTGSILSGNEANKWGGGIHNGNSGALTLIQTSLVSNTAALDGGGIFNTYGGTLSVTRSTLSGNSAAWGGGIRNLGTLSVTQSTVGPGNIVTWAGGGIFNNGHMTLVNSTITGNSGTGSIGGGGIYNEGALQVTGSTISDNETNVHGGGILVDSGIITLTHTTLSGNTADADHDGNGGGGGIWTWSSSQPRLVSSIIAGNGLGPGSAASGPDLGGAFASLGYNLVGNSDGSTGFVHGVNHDQVGSGATPIDPLLGSLGDNGGSTWTHALLLGSPALDAGSCPGATTDQRGFPRPVDLLTLPNADDGCDIGATEFQDVAIRGLAASNDGPTVLGQPTAYAAAVTAGTHVSYAWDFGDGGSGTGPNPSHTYAAVGQYTATVTATNSAGSKTATTTVTVDQAIGGLSASNDGPTVLGQPTAYAATVTAGTNVSYAWDFGDGGSGSGPNPSHTYAAVGQYTATVTATNSAGSDTATTTVTVDQAIGGLSASNDGPTVLGQPTGFAATVTAGTNVSYAWDFGDGGSGSGPSPSHTYAQPGVYTATVTASNSVGSVGATTTVTIEKWKVYLPLVLRAPASFAAAPMVEAEVEG